MYRQQMRKASKLRQCEGARWYTRMRLADGSRYYRLAVGLYQPVREGLHLPLPSTTHKVDVDILRWDSTPQDIHRVWFSDCFPSTITVN